MPSDKKLHDSINDFFEGENEQCCDSPKIAEEDGFYVCLNCGCVISRILDSSPRRAFTAEEIQKRKSNERVYSPIGPRTIIRGSRDARGTLLSPKYKSKFNRLAKIHRSLTTSYERNLWIALPNLQRLQKRLGIPDPVAEDALRIYTQTVKKKLTMGRSIDTLLSASIFAALRIHGIPRTVEEITKVAQIPKKKVIKSYRLILMEILPKLNLKVQHFTPDRYVDKFNDELGLSMQCRNIAVKLIGSAKKNGFDTAGKDPKGIAAAAIYLGSKICNENRTQKEISKLAKVTEVTLRMRVKDLQKFAKIV
ncbi:MAG: transcription initiation factor IIB [Promethearchaeota archaeon]|nr:MAG: transcription initiation factor IIB [Candidatus Lokiarchaeota archaeon]